MKKYLLSLAILLVAVMGAVLVLAQETDADVEAKIESAMSAAPMIIAEEATILDWAFDDEGNFIVLQEGTNDWSCLPGNPKPMCLDGVFMEWLYALMAGEDLTVTTIGYTYMLHGGGTNSNADPAAAEPADDEWVSSEPFMMVILPTDVDLSDYSTDPNDPIFVMFGGTPYQHIMIQVGDMAEKSGGM